MARRYDATAPLPIAGFRIRDSHPGRWYNVPETLIESSNIATARIADELGREKLEALFRSVDFDKRPEIALKERAFPDRKSTRLNSSHKCATRMPASPCKKKRHENKTNNTITH